MAGAAMLASDALWQRIRGEAQRARAADPVFGAALAQSVLAHDDLAAVLSDLIGRRLGRNPTEAARFASFATEAFRNQPDLVEAASRDLQAIAIQDPAIAELLAPLLHYKGYVALQAWRVANWLWQRGRHTLAAHLQNRISEAFGVDIHPAARIGSGILIDHGTSVVIGETAVVEDNVSMLHEVTLGGTGKEGSDRHPKIGNGVLIGAGAKILGNIHIGNCSRVAAGSVVLKEVPSKTTVAGVPARVVGEAGCSEPSRSMDQLLVSFEI